MITPDQIKKLLHQTTSIEERNEIINQMLSGYELHFTHQNLQETYSNIRNALNKNEKLDVLGQEIIDSVVFVLEHSLNENILMHSCLLRAIYDGKFKIEYFQEIVVINIYENFNVQECICDNEMEIHVNVAQCPYDLDNEFIFRILLEYGYFNYEKYCDKVTKKYLDKCYDEMNNGKNTKGIIKL